MTVFLDFVASTVKAFFLFMTFDFVKVTIKSRLHVGSTINFVHYVEYSENNTKMAVPRGGHLYISRSLIYMADWA